MRILAAAIVAATGLATSPLMAADILGGPGRGYNAPSSGGFESAPSPLEGASAQGELGSNWYIRGDVGYGTSTQDTVQPNGTLFPTVRQGGYIDQTNTFIPVAGALFNDAPTGSPNGYSSIVRGNPQSRQIPNFDIGVGYRVNDWFRVEATYGITPGAGLKATGTAQCVTGMTAVSNLNTTTGVYVPFGNTLQTSTCSGAIQASQINQTGMATAYLDLGHWWILNPFVGAGVGLNANRISGGVTWSNPTTGAPYAGTTTGVAPYTLAVATNQTDKNGLPIYAPLVDSSGKSANGLYLAQGWNRNFYNWRVSFAGQLAAGVGVQLSQSSTMDLTYKIQALDVSSFKNLQQSVNVGVRYNLN